MQKSVDRESVLTNLRSVAQSLKGGVPVDRLQDDYRSILGENIPFRELGFKSLDAFLRDIPDVIKLERASDGRLMAVGVADSSTAHIVSLISRQKATDTRRGRRVKRAPPHHYTSRTSRYSQRGGFSSNSTQRSNRSPPLFTSKQSSSRRSPPARAPVNRKPEVATVQSDYSNYTATTSVPRGQSSFRRNYRTEIPPRFQSQRRPPPVQNEWSPAVENEWSPAVENDWSPTVEKEWSPPDENEWCPPPRAPVVKPKSPEYRVPARKLQPISSKSTPKATDRAADLSESLDNARTAKAYVEIYARANRMTFSYKTDRIGQKRKGYVSKLFLGEKTYNSYPEDANTPDAAEEEAAKKAKAYIKESRAHLALLPETAYSNAEEVQTLLGRIEEIVWEKPSGMFTNGIIDEYENKYQERLPSCWMDLLKQSTAVEIEALEIQCGNVPKGAKFIVRPSKDASSGNVTPSSSSSKSEVVNDNFDTKGLQKSLVEISLPQVDEIQIPVGNQWPVYICCVKDVLFARLFDYDEAFCALSYEMKDYYNLKKYYVKDIFENQVYAVCEDDPDIWHRAIAVEIKENSVLCYLVDSGEYVNVERENVQEMFPKFLSLPFQAIMINLDGLEEYEPYINLDYLESDFLGQSLIAEVKRWWSVPDWLPENSGIHNMGYSVILWNTSDLEDINMNEQLKAKVLSSLPCELPKKSISSCAYLSHVTPAGNIYLRFSHPEANLLELELEKFATAFEAAALRKSAILPNTMCAAKCSDGKWHRVVSNHHIPDPNAVEVFLVDFGSTETVNSSNICDISSICPNLVSVPYQAIMCELFDALPSPDAKWTDMATIKLREMAPAHEEIMIRVMFAQDDSTLAKVNLYKRNKDSEIVTINHTLCSRPDLFGIPIQSCRLSLSEKQWIPRHLQRKIP